MRRILCALGFHFYLPLLGGGLRCGVCRRPGKLRHSFLCLFGLHVYQGQTWVDGETIQVCRRRGCWAAKRRFWDGRRERVERFELEPECPDHWAGW